MVVDVTYILNELDMLEARLTMLDKYVDRFVIIEAGETFSGVPKGLCLLKNMARFSKWKEKITYHVVSQFPQDKEIFNMAVRSPNTGGQEIWVREFFIKEGARRALEFCKDDDVVFISDMDEIWNPTLTFDPKGSEVLKPKQLPYLYYFNQRTDENWLGWTGTTVCRYQTIKDGIINHIRTDELMPYTVLEQGGWHFNSIGGKKKKQRAAKHPLVYSQADWDRREINMRKDESELPKEILNLKTKWPHYFI